MARAEEGKEITVKVKRYRPTSDEKPVFQEYTIPLSRDMVVLDALNYIKDQLDGTLTYRYSCRMGVCGSCGANVNGTPKLTCETFIRDIESKTVTVEPLPNFPIIKDLVVDIDDFMSKLKEVQPWIVREEKPVDQGEYLQTPEQMELYRQQSMCINCMLCYAACPAYGADDHFMGPAALALAYRYIMDSRDQGKEERLKIATSDVGSWECSWVGECTTVCPKHVDPAIAIQGLKVLGAKNALQSILMPKSKRRST